MITEFSEMPEVMRLREIPLRWLEDSTETDTATLELGSAGSGLGYVVCCSQLDCQPRSKT
jgi:hypothetical protein